jgi:acetolactate synthase-1/2/3 large subunit
MNRVAELLQVSKRPLILLGAGARQAAPNIITFAELFDIPMETTWNAVDLVPFDHPLFVGRPGIVATRGSNMAIQACDLLIAIGARLDQPTVAYDYEKFAPNAKKVMVDIDISESLKIPNLDVFVHQDATKFILELSLSMRDVFSQADSVWSALCQGWKSDRLEGTTTTYQLLDELSEDLPEDEIIVMDCGCIAVAIFCAGFRNKAGQRFIMSSCGLGSMGASISVAIGAAIASGKHVTCISGDGSFMQNIQELEIADRLRLPITFIVIDNKGYASIRNSEMRVFGRTKGSETIPDIASMIGGFDWCHICIVGAEIVEPMLPRVEVGIGDFGSMYPYE